MMQNVETRYALSAADNVLEAILMSLPDEDSGAFPDDWERIDVTTHGNVKVSYADGTVRHFALVVAEVEPAENETAFS